MDGLVCIPTGAGGVCRALTPRACFSLAVVGGLAVGLVACGDDRPTPPAPPAPPAASGIIFSAGNGEGDVYVMDADGSDRRRLTEHAAADFDPVWSPDGRRVAFRSHRDGDEEVYVMGSDGSRERNLTRNPGTDYSPAWSPDGKRIAFASDREDPSGNDIYVVGADGHAARRVVMREGIDEYPTWSPDGERIAFACTGGRVLEQGVGDFEVCVVELDSGRVAQLTDAPGLSDAPAWSPDGRRIAFESDRRGWPSLPDYRPPAYEKDRYGDKDVWVMDADGTRERNVTRNAREDDRGPAWSPDGRRLVYDRYGDLYVQAVDGGRARRLTDVGTDGFPDWCCAARR